MLSRREASSKRDRSKTLSLDSYPNLEIADRHSIDPSASLVLSDLKEAIDRQLTEQERKLLELRRRGVTWSIIAEEFGEDQAVLRKRLSRAVNRVSVKLGLIVEDDQ
jgi:DNA-binding NarL/FixJ family response regulator